MKQITSLYTSFFQTIAEAVLEQKEKNYEEKWTVAQRPVGNHRIHQYGVPGADKEGKGQKKYSKK